MLSSSTKQNSKIEVTPAAFLKGWYRKSLFEKSNLQRASYSLLSLSGFLLLALVYLR